MALSVLMVSRVRFRSFKDLRLSGKTVGVFLLLGGNALVAVSENMGTPTSIVSLIIALIPLWLALAAIVPPTWTSVQRFFGISVVLSLVTWGALARQVRGSVLIRSGSPPPVRFSLAP